MAVGTSEPQAAIQGKNNRQPEKRRRRRKCQPANCAAKKLPEVPTNQATIVPDGSSKGLDEPGRQNGKEDSPDRNDPIEPLRRFLVLHLGHISTLDARPERPALAVGASHQELPTCN
jgi:hypothetical protein